jgi:hypothetical protein
MTVLCENSTEDVSALCEQNVDILMLNLISVISSRILKDNASLVTNRL